MQATHLAKLLLRLALVVAPTLSLAALTDHRLGAIPNSYVTKRGLFEAAASKVQILVLGSSHTYYGLDPNRLPLDAFNLAHVSQSVEYDGKLLDKYLPALPRLRCVVIPVSYFSLRTELEDGPEAWRCFYYERVYGIPSPFAFWDPKHYTRLALFTPQESLAMALNPATARINSDRFDAHGGLASPITSKPLTEADGAAGVAQDDARMQAAYTSLNVARLDAVMQQLAARHVFTVLLTAPVHRTYYEHTDPRVCDEIATEAGRLVRAHQGVYKDYFRDARFVDADFQNVDHLNARGATKLTDLLASELVQRL